MYLSFQNIILSGFDIFIPKFSAQSKKFQYPLYINKLIEYKSQLWKNAHHPPVLEKYKKASEDLDKHLKKYTNYVEKKALAKSNNAIYKYVERNLRPKYSKINSIISNGRLILGDKNIANALHQHFQSVHQQAPSIMTPAPDPNLDPLFDSSLAFISEKAVYDALDALHPSLNPTPDGIPSYVLKNCKFSLTQPLTYIFRYSFLFGQTPDIWKLAHITPIPKKPNPSSLDDFRPISVTSSVSKVCEKILLDDISGFVKIRDIIPESQHGFREHRSVVTSLIESYDDITTALDRGLNVDSVYLDLSKAFDLVDHDLLISKLINLGFGPIIVSWIKSFLSNRKYTVKINKTFSDKTHISTPKGVPQGCILSPFLFNLFVSDIAHGTESLKVTIKQYADDIKAYTIFPKNNISATEDLQNFLHHFSTWAKANGQKANTHKSFVVHLGNSNPKRTYTLDNHDLQIETGLVRDLGLYFSPDLKWTRHVELACKKAYARWFNLSKFFKTSNSKILTRLYKVYVRPVLEFGSPLYNSHTVNLDKLIERVQRRITRIIIKRCLPKKYFQPPPYHIRCALLDLQTLKLRRTISDLTLFQKIHTNPQLISNKNRPTLNKNSRTRGNNIRYTHNHVRTNLKRNSFFIRTPKLYNLLPRDIQDINDPKIFKMRLTRFQISTTS
jgi:hypothetical protein